LQTIACSVYFPVMVPIYCCVRLKINLKAISNSSFAVDQILQVT